MPKSVRGVMDEFKHGELHSGSSSGPRVKHRKQAIAIALSEQRQTPEHKTVVARKQREALRATTESHAYNHRSRNNLKRGER